MLPELTVKIFSYFKEHKAVMYVLLTVTTLVFAALGLRLKFEEDISKLLPSTDIGTSQQLVFNNLKVKDKIFLLFVPKDSIVTTDDLAAACEAFSDSLVAHDSDGHINNILYKLDEDLLLSGMTYLYENLPVFLEDGDYARIDSLLTKEAIEEQMSTNFDELQSASSMFTYDLIRLDPAGMRGIMMAKGAKMAESLGGSYKILDGHFFTPDSTTAIAFLTPNFKAFDSKAGTLLTGQIEDEIAEFSQAWPDVQILFHGSPIQSVFNSRQIKKDLLLTLGVSLLLVCLFIAYSFKNTSTLPLMLLPVAYGTLFAMACLYMMYGTMSLMALGIGAIVLGVALSYCLHIITHYKYVSDPVRVLREETTPVLLGSITTIGAFMGLLFTDSALLRDFGLFATLAMVGTTIFCLIFLPQFLNPDNNKQSKKVFKAFDNINSYPFHEKKWLVALLVIICGICCFYSGKVQFDTDLKNIGYTEPSVARSQKILSEKTAQGNATLYFASVSSDIDSAFSYNAALACRLDSLEKAGVINGFSNTSAIMLPEKTQEERIARWKEFWTDEKIKDVERDIISAGGEYGLTAEFFDPFFELISKNYEPSNIYNSGILPEGLMSNFVEYTDSTYLVFTPVKVEQGHTREACDKIIDGHGETVVIDPFYYTNDMVKMLTDNYNVIMNISSLFVLAVLLLSYRSITLSLIAFFPMFVSWYVVLGAMAIFGIKFNLINIIISSFIFGVGVDYSIFIMGGLIAGSNNKGLLLHHKTAVFLSAVVLIISISSMIFATHPAMSSIGVVTLIGMACTLMLTYTLQPFVFNLMMKFGFFQKIVRKRA